MRPVRVIALTAVVVGIGLLAGGPAAWIVPALVAVGWTGWVAATHRIGNVMNDSRDAGNPHRPSGRDDHEPASLVQHIAAPELRGELGAREEALEHAVH